MQQVIVAYKILSVEGLEGVGMVVPSPRNLKPESWEERVRKYIANVGIPWRNHRDPDPKWTFAYEKDVPGVPTMYLLDRDGCVVMRASGDDFVGDALVSAFRALLKKEAIDREFERKKRGVE